MIPRSNPTLSCELPSGEFWTPGRAELMAGEGFGPYRDTWPIARTGIRVTLALIDEEQAIVECVSALAPDADTFDGLLRAVEWGDLAVLADHSDFVVSPDACINGYIQEDEPGPGFGIDLGVAGLVHALSAVGCFPAASCRGHAGRGAWSDWPIVRFAARRWRAQLLLELARSSGCGLVMEDGLLTTWAPSVAEMMSLAQAIMDARKNFARAPGGSSGARRRAVGAEQLSLFPSGTSS